MSKKINPLFVVTNSGKDMESADNWLEAALKKVGADFVYNYLKILIDMVMEKFRGIVALEVISQAVAVYEMFLMEINNKFSKGAES